MRLLIAEDDEITRELLREVLESGGHEVVAVANGEEATQALARDRLRLVISDWMMPVMDGIGLCKWIRRQAWPWYTYVILLTSRRETGDVIEGLSAGADEFLGKPVDHAELEVRIRTGERILALEGRHLVIFSMAKLAESRDPETGLHLERVREYCRLLAEALTAPDLLGDSLRPEFAENIYLTSPLHDIGKVGIPDYILLKPGRLSDDEFRLMKRHTVIGGETLNAALEQCPGAHYLSMAADIALAHHEHYDGNGYPHGLRGDEIPLPGRVVAVADVYDALTSKRVYKAAFSHDLARSYIDRCSGSQFDPVVGEAFRRTEGRFQEIRERFLEPPDERPLDATAGLDPVSATAGPALTR
jgi:putative two-component system response regulator